MGSCVSSHKEGQSVAKLGTNNEKLLIPSPVKEKPNTVNEGDRTPSWLSPGFHGGGSKGEAFFDSQPWLDSDGENDYFSVNGDLRTPSAGSTPVHHSFQPPKPVVIPHPEDDDSAAFSTERKKKRLSELFRESLGGDEQANFSAPKIDGDEKSANGTTQRTPDGALRARKASRAADCCIPKLLSSRSFNGRRKRMSPGGVGR